jgi:glycosyltransferase involved in cell wall biosynthesis
VVQEYAASGFPLLVSEAVGAKEAFVQDAKNGFVFKASDTKAIKEQLKKFVKIDSKELNLMGANSHALAQQINKQQWAQTLIQIYHDHKTN